MCIAIVAPADAEIIPARHFNNSWENNADGIGLVYVENGEFRVVKTLDRCDLVYDEYLYARSIGSTSLIHFRKATHGKVSEQNCHPFPNGTDEFYVHNGVLSIHALPEHEVDSRLFADRILKHLPKDWRELPDIVRMVESYLSGSKVAILSRLGEVTILNEKNGYWDAGSWYSNKSYSYSYRDKKAYAVQSYYHSDYGYGYGSHYGHSYGGSNLSDKEWYEHWGLLGDDDVAKQRRKKETQDKPAISSFDSKRNWKKDGNLYIPFDSVPLGEKLSTMVTVTDLEFDMLPYGYQWNGYDICTWCLPESMLEIGADLIPIYLEGDETEFECVSCLTEITRESPKIRCTKADGIILENAFSGEEG